MSEMERIATNTTWNTMSILNGDDKNSGSPPVYTLVGGKQVADTTATVDGETISIQLGAAASQVMTVTLKSWVPSSAVDTDATSAAGASNNGQDNFASGDKTSAFADAILYWGNSDTPTRIDISSSTNSSFAVTQLDKAIQGVSNERATFGAYMARLTHSADNLTNVAQNTDQSRSRIEDADYAVETSELARTQIISQAATAMLAQANQSKQGVLSLLQ